MLSIRKILVPVNFTANCKGALLYAESLAAHFASEVTILHVLEPAEGLEGIDPSSIPVIEYVRNREAKALRELESFFASNIPENRLTRTVVEGDPGIQIVRFAETHETDFIVMPTHGYGPIRQFLLGSVTAKVLHDVKCPVWTGVHMESASVPDALQIRSVGCAVDLGPQTRAIMCQAAEFARSWGAKLHVFYIGPNVPEPEWNIRMETVAREQISSHETAIGVPCAHHIAFGSIPTLVNRLAREQHIDVLMVGRSHRSGGGHLPTNTYAISRGAPCPVISV